MITKRLPGATLISLSQRPRPAGGGLMRFELVRGEKWAKVQAVAYALFNLQERGRLFVEHNTEVYEGMVVGIHSRSNDLVVNPLKAKQLTNIRAAGSDENIVLTPKIDTTLEYCLEFINDDELIEVTPKSIRIRKKFLKEHERKKSMRAA
jgi:GTP-binding protein